MNNDILPQIRRFPRLKIVVLGDIMLDLYDFCATPASKPIDSEKPGKRAYAAQQSVRMMGGAGNVAANLASLGVSTSLIGVTGNDGHYFTLQQIADGQRVKHCFIRDRDRPTTTKSRLYIDGEYLLRRDDEAVRPASHETGQTLLNELICELDGANAVILSDYHKGVFTPGFAQQVLAACRARSVPVVVDFKPVNKDCFRGAAIIAPNAQEAEALRPGFNSAPDLEAEVRGLYDALACDNLVVTLGERGICGFDGRTFFRIPGNRVTEVDAVGCGDTVRAVLALGHALGFSLADAADLANDAAAVIVQKPATSLVTRPELIAFIERKSAAADTRSGGESDPSHSSPPLLVLSVSHH